MGLLRARAADESGITILYVLGLTVITILIGTVVLTSVLNSNQLTTHDARQRRAQQASDAGVQTQLYEQGQVQAGNAGSPFDLNGGLLGTGTLVDCDGVTLNSSLQITGIASASATGSQACGSSGSGPTPCQSAIRPVGNQAYDVSCFYPGAKSILSGASPVELQPRIVSLGWDQETSQPVYSRVEAILNPIEPLPVIGGNDNITVNGVTLGSAGLLQALLNATLSSTLGSLSVSVGLSASVLAGDSSLASVVDGDLAAANNVTLPAVDAGLNLALDNTGGSAGHTKDNGLTGLIQLGVDGTLSPANAITTSEVQHDGPPPQLPISVSSATPYCPTTAANCGLGTTTGGTPFYSSLTHEVNVPAGQTMTISTSGTYVFCNVTAAGNIVVSPSSSTQPVEIFIDSPGSGRCLGNSPTLSSSVNAVTGHVEQSEGNFVAQSGVTCVTCLVNPSQLQIYDVGDDPEASNPYDDDTYVQIGSGFAGASGGLLGGLASGTANQPSEAMVVYAPTSEVSMTTVDCLASIRGLGVVCVPGTFEGNLIGDDVNATALLFEQDLDLGNYALYNGINLYRVGQYVQCTPVTSLTGNEATDLNGC